MSEEDDWFIFPLLLVDEGEDEGEVEETKPEEVEEDDEEEDPAVVDEDDLVVAALALVVVMEAEAVAVEVVVEEEVVEVVEEDEEAEVDLGCRRLFRFWSLVELRGRFAAERRTGGVVRRDEDICVQVHKKFVSVVCTALFVCCSFFLVLFLWMPKYKKYSK